MPKFIFKLEVVLRQRKGVEEMRQRELTVVIARLNVLQAQLRDLDQTVRAAEEELRNHHLTGRIDLNYLGAHRRFSNSMQRKAMELAQVIAGASGQVDEARKKLIDAARQRKVMEKLRERQHTRWKAEQERKELMELDEISVQQTLGKMAEEDSKSDWNAV